VCGIVGYVGRRPAIPFLLDGLGRLEYRGYDSAGVMLRSDGRLWVEKRRGRLGNLVKTIEDHPTVSTVGAGHTRWATHGRPSDTNAHPHLDCTGGIGVVHNGIIENYLRLRRELESEGHRFRSDTDTEVLPHLIEKYYRGDLRSAVQRALRCVQGSFAIAVMTADGSRELVGARRDSPLVVGLGKDGNFLASDIPAILPYTRSVYVLDDDEMAVVRENEVPLYTLAGEEVDKPVYHVEWDAAMAEKDGYEDFMLKEIHEQPRAVRDTLKGRIDVERGEPSLDELGLTGDEIAGITKVFIIACGTAWHAGLVGKRVLESLTGLPVEVDLASEFRYRSPLVDEGTLAVIVSQSGETADTLAGLREARDRRARILAITNVVGSSIAREAERVMYTRAGPEIAVASTKAYMTQLVSLYLISVHLGLVRGTLSREKAAVVLRALKGLPEQIAAVLKNEGRLNELGRRLRDKEHVFFIGRGLDHAVAMEGALKLKEISYIHAEAYAAGELKHGTLALIEDGVPVFALLTQRLLYDKMLSNIKEVKARGAEVVAVVSEEGPELASSVDHMITIPTSLDLVAPMLAVVPLQLFAYYAAKWRGCDVDRPRNLAKSVTVE